MCDEWSSSSGNTSKINGHDLVVEDGWHRDTQILARAFDPRTLFGSQKPNPLRLRAIGQTHPDFLFADGNQLAHRPLHHHWIREVDALNCERFSENTSYFAR